MFLQLSLSQDFSHLENSRDDIAAGDGLCWLFFTLCSVTGGMREKGGWEMQCKTKKDFCFRFFAISFFFFSTVPVPAVNLISMPHLFHVALSLCWAHQWLCAYLHLYYLCIFWLSRYAPSQTNVLTIHIPLRRYGLLGPSGCGKTTLLKCIVGTLKISRGRITVLGKPPAFPGHQVPGRMVGYMPQVFRFMQCKCNLISFLSFLFPLLPLHTLDWLH